MTDEERQIVQAYITTLARQVGLRDWITKLAEEPCEPGNDAQIICTYGQRHLKIRVAAEFRKETPEDQRDTIVHELVHAHLDPCLSMIDEDLEDQLGGAAHALFAAAFRRNLEFGVDGLTKALAKHLPLIDWRLT